MKVRKLAVALALAGGLGSGVAQALGLGEIELQSYLNQPLNAEIDVNRAGGVDPDEIVVNLASERDYERVGLRRDYFLSQLNFSVTTAPDGDLVISVTSKEPVREPYLNFLVEVTWPSGRVMREYSVLVDPPVYAEDGDDAARAPVQSAQSEQRGRQSRSEPGQPRTREAGEPSGSRSAGPRTLGPVQASDTLWEIARSVRPDNSVSTQQVMLAIQDLNQGAFINGNINRLKRGEVLRVPDMDDIRARTQAEANREVAAQNRAFAQPQPEPEVDATESGVAGTGTGDSTAGQASSGELRLVVPEDGDERSEGSAGGDGRQGGSADAGQAVAMEELDRVQRENDELNSRLEDLQDQVETLQRLIELKDSQLAEIQGSVGDDAEPATTAPDDGAGAAAPDTDEGQLDPADQVDAGEQADSDPSDIEDADSGLTQPATDDEETALTDPATDTAAQDDEAGQPQQPDEQTGADDPVAATGAQPESEQAQSSAAEQEAQERGFLATAIDLIAGNFLYQIALGGFLVLLLLLVLLISRRRAANDDEFYQQLDDDGEDSFELNLGEDDAAESASALDEADRYISYGQHDAAAEVLENAISREPSRSDLRLKLLAVYADTGNRSAFDKQYAELEAMEFEDAQPEAEALRARLEDMESTPSIDELESQLRGGESFGSQAEESTRPSAEEESNDLMAAFDELDTPEDEAQAPAGDEEAEEKGIDYDFSGFDTSVAETPREDTPAGESDIADDLASIDFELPEDDAGLTEADETAAETPLDLENDFTSLDLDDAGIDSQPQAEDVEGAAEPAEEDDLDFGDLDLEDDSVEGDPVDRSSDPEDEADLDESFLDELDAELDKVASEGTETDGLDDLELDVSDEDLALMDQASGSEPEDESQLDLGDLDLDESDLEEASGSTADDLGDLDIPELEDAAVAEDTRMPSEEPRTSGSSSIDEIDEGALGGDDDFDFLSGTDEVATKLDLARAYVDMGDSEGAREILEEVILEGTDEQKSDAQTLLKKLP